MLLVAWWYMAYFLTRLRQNELFRMMLRQAFYAHVQQLVA